MPRIFAVCVITYFDEWRQSFHEILQFIYEVLDLNNLIPDQANHWYYWSW